MEFLVKHMRSGEAILINRHRDDFLKIGLSVNIIYRIFMSIIINLDIILYCNTVILMKT